MESHPLQVQDRILFPAAGMLVMSLAVASTLCTLGSDRLALVGCSISAPLVLTAAQPAPLSCTINHHGQIKLASGAPSAMRTHMTVSTGELAQTCVQAVVGHCCLPAWRLTAKLLKILAGIAMDNCSLPSRRLLRTTAPSVQHLLGESADAPYTLATGTLDSCWLRRQGQPSGFLMHPAALDAATHTAAALQASQQAEEGVMRIPVGVSALLASRLATAGEQQWCRGLFAGMAADGSALADFAAASGARTGVQLVGFQAKPVATSLQSSSSKGNVKGRQPAADLLYVTDWQAEQPAAWAAAACPQQMHTWQLASDHDSTAATMLASRAHSPAAVVSAASAGLALLQRLLVRQGTAPIRLRIAAAPSPLVSAGGWHSATAAAAAASVAALAKAASMEFASAGLSSCSLDALAPGAAAALPSPADTFGTAATQGAVLRAKLLRQQALVMLPNSHLLPMPRGSLADLRLVPHERSHPGPGEVTASGAARMNSCR